VVGTQHSGFIGRKIDPKGTGITREDELGTPAMSCNLLQISVE
jgi:hypothetical protein